MERYEVVVVGGGPAGAVVAAVAARRGARVLLLERSPARPPRCTGLVGPRLLDLLAVPGRLVVRTLRAVRVRGPRGAEVEFWAPGPRGYVLDRPGFDRWLLGQAAAAGAVVQAPVAATGVTGQVLRTTAGPVRFEVLVGADGPGSAVRQWAGLPPPGEILVGVQAVVEGSSAQRAVEIHLGRMVAPGGFAWVVPAEEGLLRVGLLTTARREGGELLRRFLSRFRARVVRWESGLVPVGPPARTVGERVLVVGDAAGQVKPLTGGGLLFGAVAAQMAGEGAVDGPGKLSGYESRWREELGAEIAFGLRARRMFLSLSDAELDAIVSALDSPEVRGFVAAEGDLDRPSRLVEAALPRPRLWSGALPILRALGLLRARELGRG